MQILQAIYKEACLVRQNDDIPLDKDIMQGLQQVYDEACIERQNDQIAPYDKGLSAYFSLEETDAQFGVAYARLEVGCIKNVLKVKEGESTEVFRKRAQQVDAMGRVEVAKAEVRVEHAKLNDKLYPGC